MHKKNTWPAATLSVPPRNLPSTPSTKKINKKTHPVIWTKNSSVVPPVFSLHGNSTFIAVLNLISKWACWLQRPHNEECNLSGHKHPYVHIGEHRCTPREVQLLPASLAFDFTSVITVSFVPKAVGFLVFLFFLGGEGQSVGDLNFLLSFVRSHSSNIKHSRGRARVHLSARTLSISVRRHNFDE